jgi:uncharacterized protein (TIGR02246 family)
MTHAATDAESSAIQAVADGLDSAWNRGDAEAFASRFAPDGSFTNVLGMVHNGREAFRARHDAIFKTIFKGSTSKLVITTLRFVRPDVAIADLDAEIRGFGTLPPGMRADADGAGRSKLLMVFVKDGGTWWISAYHNVGITPLPVKP